MKNAGNGAVHVAKLFTASVVRRTSVLNVNKIPGLANVAGGSVALIAEISARNVQLHFATTASKYLVVMYVTRHFVMIVIM